LSIRAERDGFPSQWATSGHSITSSAMARSVRGSSIQSALAD
jgi:hypothetical protein